MFLRLWEDSRSWWISQSTVRLMSLTPTPSNSWLKTVRHLVVTVVVVGVGESSHYCQDRTHCSVSCVELLSTGCMEGCAYWQTYKNIHTSWWLDCTFLLCIHYVPNIAKRSIWGHIWTDRPTTNWPTFVSWRAFLVELQMAIFQQRIIWSTFSLFLGCGNWVGAMAMKFETKCKRYLQNLCIYQVVFGVGPSNAANHIFMCES